MYKSGTTLLKNIRDKSVKKKEMSPSSFVQIFRSKSFSLLESRWNGDATLNGNNIILASPKKGFENFAQSLREGGRVYNYFKEEYGIIIEVQGEAEGNNIMMLEISIK